MATTHTTPVPARTDAYAATDTAADGGRVVPSGSTVRRLALITAAGAATWGVATILGGVNANGSAVLGLSSLAFQLGVLALLRLQVMTRATGLGKVARRFFVLEHVLLAGAIVSTLNDVFLPGIRGTVIWGIFDACWPLSMLGMFGIGIRIAIAGRWQGLARFWPLVAESWAVVTVPVAAAVPAIGGYVGGGHLLIGYTALGLIIAARPDLVRR